MGKKEEAFLKRLRAMFKVEAEEHLNAISSGLTELESVPPVERQVEITEVVLREVHSLKGASRAVSMTDIEAVCQHLEQLLGAVRPQETSWRKAAISWSAGMPARTLVIRFMKHGFSCADLSRA